MITCISLQLKGSGKGCMGNRGRGGKGKDSFVVGNLNTVISRYLKEHFSLYIRGNLIVYFAKIGKIINTYIM